MAYPFKQEEGGLEWQEHGCVCVGLRLGGEGGDGEKGEEQTAATHSSEYRDFLTCGQWGVSGNFYFFISPSRLVSHGWSVLQGPSHSSFQ